MLRLMPSSFSSSVSCESSECFAWIFVRNIVAASFCCEGRHESAGIVRLANVSCLKTENSRRPPCYGLSDLAV
jgi:hypothetical protein